MRVQSEHEEPIQLQIKRPVKTTTKVGKGAQKAGSITSLNSDAYSLFEVGASLSVTFNVD